MAFKTVSNLRDSVAAILSGVDLNNVDDVNGAFERAARILVQKAKIPETQGTQNGIIYSGVTDYLIDTRIFGTNIIDIRPQGVSRQPNNTVYKQYQEDFDLTKGYSSIVTRSTFDYFNGTPIIKIISPQTKPAIILDSMTSTTGWTAGGSASGLTQDPTFYYQAPASLRFNLATSGTQGTLTKSISPIDLTTYQGVGVAFLAVELPTDSVTLYTLRLGSSASDYYQVTNTTPTLVNVTDQFMLVAFDLSLASTTGSPDIANIDYARIMIDYDGTAMTNTRVGNLFISLPSPIQILYSSAGFFLVDETVSTTITSSTDEIILNDAAYTLYQYECALAILEQTGGGEADSNMIKIERKLNDLYNLYRADNPSESIKTVGSWYDGGGYNSNYGNRSF